MALSRADISPFGLLNIHKPAGPTSHDVVGMVRRGARERRVGHAGTLDPLAEGVLVLALGKATRLLEYLVGSSKRYRATLRLGITTDTYDIQGDVVEERSWPEDLTADELRTLLQRDFVGELLQVPPVFSAIKIKGRAAYARARAGEPIEMQPRPIEIHSLKMVAFDPPDVTLDVHCGSGTYLRSLAHDVGQALGCGATLAGLTRLASGAFGLQDSVSLEALQAAFDDGTWPGLLLPAERALAGTPEVHLDAEAFEHLKHGRPIRSESGATGLARAYGPKGRFVAVLVGHDDEWRPKKVFV